MTKANKAGKKIFLLFGRWWSISALILSLAMLATAWSFQLFGHLAPCHLCLKQRDIYWIAVGVSLVASVWALFTGAKGAPRVFSFVLFAIFATGTALAVFHAGAEYHFWRGPENCIASPSEVSFDQMAAFLGGVASTAPRCDVAAWTLFGVSMAGYNAIASAFLALLSLIASLRPRRRRRIPTIPRLVEA
jgi:disulfide bond formation protein DsbB